MLRIETIAWLFGQRKVQLLIEGGCFSRVAHIRSYSFMNQRANLRVLVINVEDCCIGVFVSCKYQSMAVKAIHSIRLQSLPTNCVKRIYVGYNYQSGEAVVISA